MGASEEEGHRIETVGMSFVIAAVQVTQLIPRRRLFKRIDFGAGQRKLSGFLDSCVRCRLSIR